MLCGERGCTGKDTHAALARGGRGGDCSRGLGCGGGSPKWCEVFAPTDAAVGKTTATRGGISSCSGSPEQSRHETSSGEWRAAGGMWTSMVATAAAVDLAVVLAVVLPDRLADPSHTDDPAGDECQTFVLK